MGQPYLKLKPPLHATTETLAVRVIRPYSDPLKKYQPQDRSDGGDLYVYDKAVAEQTFELNLRMNKAARDTLKFWYDAVCNGSVTPLYYEDNDGNEHVGRIMNDTFDFPELAHDKYEGTLLLRKEG